MQNLGDNEKSSRRHLISVLRALRFYDSGISRVLSEQLEFLHGRGSICKIAVITTLKRSVQFLENSLDNFTYHVARQKCHR